MFNVSTMSVLNRKLTQKTPWKTPLEDSIYDKVINTLWRKTQILKKQAKWIWTKKKWLYIWSGTIKHRMIDFDYFTFLFSLYKQRSD